MHNRKVGFRLFYVTREKYPTFRVDLTKLFSKGIAGDGCYIDWQMQSMTTSKDKEIVINKYEKVYVSAGKEGNGLKEKIMNQLFALQSDFKIARRVADNKYDIVQVRDKVFAAWIAMKAAQKKGIPFVYWMSYPYSEADLFRAKDQLLSISRFMRWFFWLRSVLTSYILYKIVLPQADKIFVQSDQMLEDVARYGISKEHMFPVPMGIDIDAVNEKNLIDINSEPLNGKEVLIYLGTMIRVRRIDFLLEMMRIILKTRPDAILLLVGDASNADMQFLKDRAEELCVAKNVIFTGFVPMERAWSYICHSNICLSPFRPSPILDSTSPTKIIEYMAWGKPVVANKHPDQSKVLSESGAGFAVDYVPEAFADACLKILDSSELSSEMGKKGVEYVKQHRTYQILSNVVAGQYKKLLSNNKQAKKSELIKQIP